MESSNKWYEKVPVQKEGENAMSEAMLALLGFATIIIVIALLLRNVTVPALAFVSVSTVTGAILVATGTFTIEEMGEFVCTFLWNYDRCRNVRQDHQCIDEESRK